MSDNDPLPLAPFNAAALTADDPPQDDLPQEPGSVIEDGSEPMEEQ
jgi:hypothetical protein